MGQKNRQIAMGGIFSALCVILMFFTGIMPFGTFFLPMVAGAMLLPIVVELGCKPAAAAYVSVSLLSVLIVPDRQAVMVFVAFFGYYPIAKQKLEMLHHRAVEYLCKLLLFNAGMAGGLAIMAYVFGVTQVLEGMGDFGRYTLPIFLAVGNVMFVLYDITLTRYYTLYIKRIRLKFLRK